MIIFAATILLGGLVVSQIIWIRRAYQLQETQVNHDITMTLKKVSREIQLHQGDSSFLLDPVRQPMPNTFVVKINENLDPYYIETMLTREFKNEEINLDFEYSLYDCFNDSVVYTKAVYINEGQAIQREEPSAAVSWKSNDGHYFSIHFPNKSAMVQSRLNFWIFSSFILIVLITFFAYTISVILKQKRLSEIKNDFINNMTHELKTPISTIALSSDVLMKPGIENNPDRLKNYAAIIQQENNRLQKQVEKVLQIATLEKDQVDLNLQPLDLHELIEQVCRSFKPLITNKNGVITCSNNAGKSMVLADEIHLTNVLNNLLDNAVKYNHNEPRIEVSTTNLNNLIQVSIRDNGIGMSPEEQKMIFDKFYRVPTGNVHDVKGFGLGLYYVKSMVLKHRGQIQVNSKKGEGTEFILEIPLNHD